MPQIRIAALIRINGFVACDVPLFHRSGFCRRRERVREQLISRAKKYGGVLGQAPYFPQRVLTGFG
jgi:hypothetical protein